MADPLSVLASIAGVATAGLAISSALYDIAQNIKRAPREVSEMAKDLSLLSSILRQLRKAIQDNPAICRNRLIKDTKSIVKQIRKIYRDIRKLTQDSTSSLYRLKLFFKSSKTKTMMAKIESSKSTANLILGTVQLAVLQAQNVGKAQNVR